MSNATSISARDAIAALGGPVAVAELLSIPSATIRAWEQDSVVPEKVHARFLALCVERGIYWRPPGWPRQVQLRWHERARRRRQAAEQQLQLAEA
jgi:hypothetical protein